MQSRKYFLRNILTTLAAACLSGLWNPFAAHADDVVRGHVLVSVTSSTDIKAFAASYGSTVQDRVGLTGMVSLSTPRNTNEQNFVQKLLSDKRVIYAEVDRLVISAEVSGQPFRMAFDLNKKAGTYINATVYSQINLGQTDWLTQVNGKQPLATGQGVTVAVLDTGATFTHPDLAGRFVAGFNALAPGQAAWDAADGATNVEVGHGTMIAGLIARLAPNAQIMPIRVLNGDGAGTVLSLVKGIDYATANGAQVLNMSFSVSTDSGSINDALDRAEAAGVVLVAAAGNSNTEQPQAPAVKHGTIAVGAVESDNSKSAYSNYGSWVRVVAPGSNIRSTYVDGGYATWSGTSFAAPFVSAEAALLLSASPGLTVEQVKSAIRDTAHSVDNQNSKAYKGKLGKGVIDVEKAVKSVLP